LPQPVTFLFSYIFTYVIVPSIHYTVLPRIADSFGTSSWHNTISSDYILLGGGHTASIHHQTTHWHFFTQLFGLELAVSLACCVAIFICGGDVLDRTIFYHLSTLTTRIGIRNARPLGSRRRSSRPLGKYTRKERIYYNKFHHYIVGNVKC